MEQQEVKNGYQFIHSYISQKYINEQCMWTGCINNPINSHAISLASIKRFFPLECLTSIEPSIYNTLKGKGRKIHNSCDKYTATFPGFCNEHDSKIFYDLDNFSGVITDKIAVLNHYRVLCFLLYKTRDSLKKESLLIESGYDGKGGKKITELLRQVKKGYWSRAYMNNEKEILIRKTICEEMIRSEQYQIYWRSLISEQDNPLFTGSAGHFFHGVNRKVYKGFLEYMPYIMYSILHDGKNSRLLFTLLPSIDSMYVDDITSFREHPDFSNNLKYLMYYESHFCIAPNALIVEKR